MYATCFKDPSLAAPGNVALIADIPNRVVAEPAIIGPDFTGCVLPSLGNVVGWFINHEVVGGDTEPVMLSARAAKAMKDVPTYAYMGGFVPTVKLAYVDYPILQAYSVPGQPSPEDVLTALEYDIGACAYAHPAWAVECTARKLPGFPVWTTAQRVWFLSEIIRLARVYRPAAIFAWAWSRSGIGLSACPELIAEWTRLVNAFSSDPKPVPPPEDIMLPPYDEQAFHAAIDQIVAVYRDEAHREPDPDSIIWAVRMQRDFDAGMKWNSIGAVEKHLWELRTELGVPAGEKPVPG